MAGISYIDGQAVGFPLTTTGNNGGVGTVSFSRGGAGNTVLTVTCATTAIDFDADGWGTGDTVIVYAGTTPNSFSEMTLASASNNTLTATGAWPDPASGTSGSGYSIILKPNVIIYPTTDTTSKVMYLNNTKNVTAKGIHFKSGSVSRNIIELDNYSSISLKNLSVEGGSLYSLYFQGTSSVITDYYPNTVLNSVYGISSTYKSVAKMDYVNVIKGTIYGFFAYYDGMLTCYGCKAVKCGTSYNANIASFINANTSVSIGHTSDDYNPNVNSDGNSNSYIYKP
jgi:hypothetical protein